ncbi:Hydroperoxy fatty acid reductase gpx1 [Thalassoglobus neptunius]|uniref:Glutathione peroxidase n=1 Tax=Thalassoglobus neptunius TaxID=1938619 RepID=A0A5C5X1G0_9PLAN|nr:Hydroperoxy fatty acid reductase gpx1 [Thalassoglobus neptunius]
MKQLLTAAVLSTFVFVLASSGVAEEANVLQGKMKTLDGEAVDLSTYDDKVVMVVNVASKCGATPQYEALQDLYETFKDDGLVVIGFPCNQFGSQEPGSAAQIREFCTSKYSVTFPMMEKIEVNGESASPLYQKLVKTETKPKGAGPIGWNFEKFLINRDGQVIARFGTSTQPDDAEVVSVIREALKKS